MTTNELFQAKFKRRLGTLLKSGYHIEDNHLVRQNGDGTKTYLLSYVRYISSQIV